MTAASPTPGAPRERAITEFEYEQFCELFYRTTGIRFGASKRYFVDKRVNDRIRETGSANFSAYLRKLKLDPHGFEMQLLVDAMTVNETYFYRETQQIDLMIQELLPELCRSKAPGVPIKILSKPCSSGEEPYSIALKLLEEWREVDDFDVNIHGSDIDSKMIERAKEGLYSERSVAKLPPGVKSRYFRREARGWRIIEELRASVDFRRVNALDRAQMMRYSRFDVVFCRNMLIYFDDVSRRKVVDAFYDVLNPGGYLVLGASETIGQSSRLFAPVRRSGLVVYRRRERGET